MVHNEKDISLRLKKLLTEQGVEFRSLSHRETHTSEESAEVRGEPLEIGGKALLLKVDEKFILMVLSATLKLDSAKLKRFLGAKKSRFASVEELHQLTGLVPGSVPPFGEPILPFPLYADLSIGRLERIAYNAGSLTESIIMKREDWQHVANPIFADLAG